MARFIEKNIICRYGLPHHVVTDNGVQFRVDTEVLLKEYKIEHHRSSPYRPQANGAVEAANKNIKRILAKTLENYKDWADYLQFALWEYRTTARTSTGITPYSLVYGCEAVLPVEVEIRSLRVLLESKIPEYQWVESRLAQLTLLDKKR